MSVLKGSFVVAADLIRALSHTGANWSMDFLTLSSYGTGTETSGTVRIVRDIVDDVRERDVLLVDDILESGFTLSFALTQAVGLGWYVVGRLGRLRARGVRLCWHPSGMRILGGAMNRWCRCAQPPANGCEPFGF